jgi:uncharacterized protein YdhG (YjbR/CyaY superfamily)
MQSKATTVDIYLNEVPEERRHALLKLRQICVAELRGYNETMRYGMPCDEKNSIAEVSFASQKNNIAIYILKQDVMERYKREFKGVSIGKGCIRFANPDKIDFDIVKKMLTGIYTSRKAIC